MNKENYTLIYFVSRTFFFGIIYSLIFNISGSDSLIAMALGTVIGMLIITIFNKVNLESKFYKFLEIILYFFLMVLEFMVVETFISTLFLVSTPRLLVILPTIILCFYAASKSIFTLKKTSFHLWFLSMGIILIAALSLTSFVKLDNLNPLFINGSFSIFKSALIMGVLSATPNILLKEEQIPLKKHLLIYVLTCLLAILIAFIILSSLTPQIAKMYRFPEYTVLKRIKIFNFIENIENILCSTLYLDHFITITLIFKRLKQKLKKPWLFYGLSLSTILFTTMFIVKNYYPVLFLYHYSYLILLGFILLFSMQVIKKLFISSERHK